MVSCHSLINNNFTMKAKDIVLLLSALFFCACSTTYTKVRTFPAFQFDNGKDYVRDGLYRIVDSQGKIGYADEDGTTVIAPRFAFGLPFENGRAKVTDTGKKVKVGEEHWRWESDDWYYIDKTGRKINQKE